jgi:hypothetical protein
MPRPKQVRTAAVVSYRRAAAGSSTSILAPEDFHEVVLSDLACLMTVETQLAAGSSAPPTTCDSVDSDDDRSTFLASLPKGGIAARCRAPSAPDSGCSVP